MNDKNIYGFYHIYMINKWFEIVSEQLSIIGTNFLYDRMTKLFINATGTEEQFKVLDAVVALFDTDKKIELQHTPTNTYEYPTLSLVRKWSLSLPNFYGFYFHTKAVTFNNPKFPTLGKHWRDYMNYYNLEEWERNVENLDIGYDLCGVKLLKETEKPANKLHYSGNFWWFNSAYVKTLPHISTLNTSSRMDAEFWICLNKPLCATLCQTKVDYKTQGEFVKPNKLVNYEP